MSGFQSLRINIWLHAALCGKYMRNFSCDLRVPCVACFSSRTIQRTLSSVGPMCYIHSTTLYAAYVDSKVTMPCICSGWLIGARLRHRSHSCHCNVFLGSPWAPLLRAPLHCLTPSFLLWVLGFVDWICVWIFGFRLAPWILGFVRCWFRAGALHALH